MVRIRLNPFSLRLLAEATMFTRPCHHRVSGIGRICNVGLKNMAARTRPFFFYEEA
jgi:hypothetical protein